MKYPLVRVRWLDSSDCGHTGWRRVDKLTPLEKEILDCITVGHLLGEDEKSLRIALSISDDDLPQMALDMITIPRCSVLEVECLTVKSTKK